ncbi:MAG: hypothetical protein IJW24_04365 [Clostridia bacterium]|nr:hypothetical protein [Clostridia bacterium]
MAKNITGTNNHYSIKKIENYASENEQKQTNMPLFVLKTFGLTILGIVFVFYYVMAICMGIIPSVASRVFDTVGSEKTALVAYEQQYKHYPSTNSLYNVIAKSVEMDDEARIIFYVPKLRKMDGYAEFEKQINKASVEKVSLVEVAFVYDIDSYLNSLFIQALYETGRGDTALLFLYQEIGTDKDKIYTRSVIPYMNCLYNDDTLTMSEKAENIIIFSDSAQISGKTMLEWVTEWRIAIEDQYSKETTIEGKIFNVYMQIKMNTCLSQIHEIRGETDLSSDYSERADELKEQYNNMVLGQ